MNHGMIKLMISRMLLILAALLCVPVLVAWIYAEEAKVFISFAITISLCLILSFLLGFKRPNMKEIYAKEGYIICAMSWFIMSAIGALPFFLSGYVPNFMDAMFETASGFTTTGSSVIPNIELLPHSLIFWRSFTHLIGGMGVLVFVIAIMPNAASNSANVNVLKAEIPGPVFGKLLPKVKDMTRTLYTIYLCMTMLVVILLWLGHMPLFDAFVHAFGIAGTGGMSSKMASIGAYHSVYIEYVVAITLVFFGMNFNLYYLLLMKQFKLFFKNEELRWYIFIISAATLLITWSILPMSQNFAEALRNAFFTTSSLMTTAGFCTVDYNKWPAFSHVIITIISIFGASAGSTAGGLKIYRVAVLFKSVKAEIIRTLSPNRVYFIQMDNKALSKDTVRGMHAYFAVYMFIFGLIVLLVSLDSPDFTTAFSATVATFNNIGPGLGAVGPTGSFAFYNNFSKFVLTFSMIAGRLEILPVLLCFRPKTWKRG